MSVNRYAAHYMFSPDGALVKWPVVSVRDNGYIESVECSDRGFVEKPSTRFFSGVLCPAFVDVYSTTATGDTSVDEFSLNRHFRDGTLFLGVSRNQSLESIPTRWPQLMHVPSADLISSEKNLLQGHGTLLERMKSQEQGTLSFAESLYFATARAASLIGIPTLGRLEEGCTPGLLLLQNIDLVNQIWMPRSSVKWLNVPESLED